MAETKPHELDFRPDTYWGPNSEWTRVIANIKGAERKRRVKEALERENPSEIEEWMVLEKLPENLRDAIGSIHPHNLGGEFLPDFAEHEVEIARVTLQSCTQDVTSIRASPLPDRIEYRITDEYDGEWSFSPVNSLEPLSMGELITLMDEARCDGYENAEWSTGVVWAPLRGNVDAHSDPLELIEFVEVTSEFYPGLRAYYASEIERFRRSIPNGR